MRIWKRFLTRSIFWDVSVSIGFFVLVGYLALMIGSMGKRIKYLEQQANEQKIRIQKAYEERDHNPIIIAVSQIEHGIASWYGEPEHGQIRADGEVYNMYELHTAAHSKLPLGTIVLVTNLKNRRSVVVQINDRLPRIWNKRGRIVDLSFAAGQEINMIRDGIIRVELKVIVTSEDLTPEMIHKNRRILETINEKR